MSSTQISPQVSATDRAGERAVWRTELSPVSFLRRAAEVHAEAPALVHGDRRFSYRKLGVRSRTELAARVAQEGLGADGTRTGRGRLLTSPPSDDAPTPWGGSTLEGAEP